MAFLMATLLAGVLGCNHNQAVTQLPSELPSRPQQPISGVVSAPPPQAKAEPIVKMRPQSVSYQPPFPERVELFVPPVRAAGVVDSDTGAAEDQVVLNGFVNVDQPRAVLVIDGQLATLAVGTQQFGVEVLSISPPSVRLKRGDFEWTDSID
jgi:hypothetical protein